MCRPLDWIPEVHHPLGSGEAVIPDALPYYRSGSADADSWSMRRAFVEVDRATMGPERLAAKITAYARLHQLERRHPSGGPGLTRSWTSRCTAAVGAIGAGGTGALSGWALMVSSRRVSPSPCAPALTANQTIGQHCWSWPQSGVLPEPGESGRPRCNTFERLLVVEGGPAPESNFTGPGLRNVRSRARHRRLQNAAWSQNQDIRKRGPVKGPISADGVLRPS
ncbi:replication-relaxation family protein [Streptomyces sp. NPDC058676]|uniref:replication-relaxation family protein n=1 Tax=unclassified Streptomyces TaxID=2593676 RepID=UPI0036645ECD